MLSMSVVRFFHRGRVWMLFGKSEMQEAEGDVVNEQNGPVEGQVASEKEEEAMDV